jgi:hypothetical protein
VRLFAFQYSNFNVSVIYLNECHWWFCIPHYGVHPSECGLFQVSEICVSINWNILTIVYNTQNYWDSRLSPLSGILYAREHNLFRNWISFCPQWLRFALPKGPNKIGVSSSHLKAETDPISETVCFLVFRIPDDGQSRETPVLLNLCLFIFLHNLFVCKLMIYLQSSFYQWSSIFKNTMLFHCYRREKSAAAVN